MAPVPDDWDWFWANEHGRDRILREEVESLSAQASLAASRASRMQSQLARLQGSLETRLTALSRAFDAYVELGDVREELAAYPDTSAIRRDVMRVIEQLAQGLPASPVDPRGLDYWLPYATNELIGLVSGDDTADRSRPVAAPEAELFVVAAAGALGHGPAVADRLPGLLTTDREFSAGQVVLFDAVVAGVYGPVLDSLEPVFRPLLRRVDPAGWLGWIKEASGSTNQDSSLNWIRALLADPAPAGAASAAAGDDAEAEESTADAGPDPRSELRTLVSGLIGAGYGAEGELLARARQLRWQIEHPGQSRPEEESGPAPADALDRVRHHLQALPVGSPEHRTLVRWLAPGLLTAIDPLAAAPPPGPAKVSVRTTFGSVEVTAAGPDAERWQRLLSTTEQSGIVPPGKLYGYGIAAAVCAALALVLALTGQSVLAVLAVIGAVILGVFCAIQLRDRQHAADTAKSNLDQMNRQLADGVERAKRADAAAIEASQERDRLAEHLRAQLTARLDAPVP